MALQPLAKKHAIGKLLGCLRGPHAGAPWLGVEQEGAPQGLGARQSGEVAQLSLTGRPQNRWEVLVPSNQPGGGLISTKTSSWSCNKNEEHQGLGVATALNPRAANAWSSMRAIRSLSNLSGTRSFQGKKQHEPLTPCHPGVSNDLMHWD